MLHARSSCVLVSEETGGGALSADAMMMVAGNQPFSIPRYGYIGRLLVDRERRGRGIGSALVDAARSWFKKNGLTAAQTGVSSHDHRGLDFWESRGFGGFLDQLRRGTASQAHETAGSAATVRPARSDDSDAVTRLWKEMMDVHSVLDGRLSVRSHWSEEVAQSVQRWLQDRSSRLLVADAADEVVGFALGGLAGLRPGVKASIYGHIAHVCVSPRWRRHGIGRQLVASLREWFVARGAHSIHAYVSCLNPVSQRFWRGLGYEDYISRLWCDIV